MVVAKGGEELKHSSNKRAAWARANEPVTGVFIYS